MPEVKNEVKQDSMFTKVEANVMIEALDNLIASKERANTKEKNEAIKEYRARDIAQVNNLKQRFITKEMF